MPSPPHPQEKHKQCSIHTSSLSVRPPVRPSVRHSVCLSIHLSVSFPTKDGLPRLRPPWLQEDFDIAEDVARWRAGSGSEERPFSFCDYPFMYDPASKAQILQMENKQEMSTRFHEAMFQSITTGGCPYLVLRVRACPTRIKRPILHAK
jgi:hypothetical protein